MRTDGKGERMKLTLAAMSAVVLLIVVSIAGAASNDQGRRLAGPFCVGKRSLKPLGTRIDARLAILRAGAVRSVARTQPCRPWEDRKLGLAWPGTVGVGPAGPAGPPGASIKGDKGDRGEKGDSVKGDRGLPGTNGTDGKDGKDGLGNGFIIACVSSGGSVQMNVNGQPCDNPGHTQLKLVIVK